MEFENTKPSVADHNTVKFRDMKNFDMESFSNDLISCDILNGSLADDDDISGEKVEISIYWYMWQTRPNEKFKTKRTIKSMDDPWHHKAYVWARPCTRQGYIKQRFEIMTRLP